MQHVQMLTGAGHNLADAHRDQWPTARDFVTVLL